MTEKMNQLMKDVPAIRWTALILLASAMFFGYIFMDILSPLQELLQTSRGWSPDAYGHYAGSETFLNVFVFFLILRVSFSIKWVFASRLFFPGPLCSQGHPSTISLSAMHLSVAELNLS